MFECNFFIYKMIIIQPDSHNSMIVEKCAMYDGVDIEMIRIDLFDSTTILGEPGSHKRDVL